jgi:PhnB protein
MKDINTYLTFDGNARQAMEFYAKCLEGKLEVMPFSQAPMDYPPEAKDRTMHACLTKGPVTLMASDTMPGMKFQQGNNFSININCETTDEQDRFFKNLGEGGNVTMPLQDTFWGARFGMLTDKFGINWMFNYELPKK